MAVQGGLVTGSLAHQIETDLSGGRDGKKSRLALPIALFVTAKLVAYTLLGFLLGWLGSALSLSPVAKGVLQIAIAVFMLGNALRMFNVHPIFRYFSFEPPKFITRMIRRKSRRQDEATTPLLLGAMTVLIPCGITQAMMAEAIALGNPLSGGLLMFAFILGTTPVFFALTYLATRLGALMEKSFMRLVAVALVIFGLISLNNGLNLVGFPYTFTNLARAGGPLFGGSPFAGAGPGLPTPTQGPLTPQLVLNVTNNGYKPERLYAPADQPITLTLVSNKTTACSRAFTVPAYNIEVLVPETGQKVVELPPQKAGAVVAFSCSMGMYTGEIVFK